MRRAQHASFPLAERPDQIFATARSKGVNPGLSRGQALRPSLRGPAARRRRRSPGDFPAASGTRSGRRERRTTTPQASPATEAKAAELEPGCDAALQERGLRCHRAAAAVPQALACWDHQRGRGTGSSKQRLGCQVTDALDGGHGGRSVVEAGLAVSQTDSDGAVVGRRQVDDACRCIETAPGPSRWSLMGALRIVQVDARARGGAWGGRRRGPRALTWRLGREAEAGRPLGVCRGGGLPLAWRVWEDRLAGQKAP